jgi:hypothetical protein
MIRFFWRFLRESEKTRAKCQGIDSGSQQIPNQNNKKSEPFKLKLSEKASMKPNFYQLLHISLAEGPQIALTVFPQN